MTGMSRKCLRKLTIHLYNVVPQKFQLEIAIGFF